MAASDSRPVPIKNTAYRLQFGIFKSDGTLITGAAGLDSEVSKDSGTFTDCTNEAIEIATASGVYYLDLTSTEMNADSVTVLVKSSSTGAVPVVIALYPQESGDIKVDIQSLSSLTLPVGAIPALGIQDNGTLQNATGSTAVIRSAASFGDDIVNNSVIEITGGVGAGQCRLIVDYTGSAPADTVTVNPNWTTTPDNTSTYIVRAAPPAPTNAAYVPAVDAVKWNGTAVSTPATAGIPDVNVKNIDNDAASASGTVTFPSATLASTTNITAGTITTVTTVGDKTGYRLSSTGVADILTTALVESYAADGAAGTLSQILFGLQAFLQERSVSGTTLTCKKLDGSTTAFTFTLNDGTAPTSITRAT